MAKPKREPQTTLTPEEQDAYRDWYEREVLPKQRQQDAARVAVVLREWQD
jgi:hypothetical protein